MKELRDFAQGICVFCDGGARPPQEMMMVFIDVHREDLGIEPICRELTIWPKEYYLLNTRGASLRLRVPGVNHLKPSDATSFRGVQFHLVEQIARERSIAPVRAALR